MSKYEAIIGMEVHIELQTASKMFASVDGHFFGKDPNRNVTPLCLGLPGTLPVINRQAVAYSIMTGLALNCTVHPYSVFARKHYFYPDLPKGYQISQYEEPLCTDGHLSIKIDDEVRRIGITRLHLEEDTGKLTHIEGGSLVDLNRAGVPLMEIVSEPDLRTAEEAYAYVSKLQQLVRYLGVSSGDMEKGAMRCEVNLSLRPVGQTEFGTKVEIKNLNSFRTVRNAIAYEIERQSQLLNAGQAVRQVTMGWDEARNVTVVQRTKEDAHDYRYFPEPDLPPLDLDPAWIEGLAAQMPELPDHKIERYVAEWGLKEEDALVLADDQARATYFETVVNAVESADEDIDPQTVANWIMGEVFRLLNDNSNQGNSPADLKFSPADLARLIALVENKTINRLAGKDVLAEMWVSGQKPDDIVAEKGLKQISDTSVLDEFVEQVIAEHPDPVAQFKGGKDQVIKFLVGQVMRVSRGKANPQLAETRLREKLS